MVRRLRVPAFPGRNILRHLLTLPVVTAALLALAACGGGQPEDRGPVVSRTARGDTTVVRTESGSVWGADATLVPEVSIGELDGDLEYLFGRLASLNVGPDGTIYVVDEQVPELRAFAPDGTYRATLGRPGEGPGEIQGPDGGLGVLSDGRILVRDPANNRIQVYGPDGEALATWPARGNFYTSRQFFWDRNDNVYTQILLEPTADIRNWVIALVRIGPDGAPGDTLVPPDAGYEGPRLEARGGAEGDQHVSRTGVPFSPGEEYTFHPGGYFVHGVSDQYELRLLRPGDPLIIQRAAEAAPVTDGERAEEEARVTRNLRQVQPNWRWSGPGIPDRKPFFDALFVGRDGRIWVTVPQPGVEVEDPDYDPQDPQSVPDRWREPVAYDVFQEDGTYLGRVATPMGFSNRPTPVFKGDTVWAVTRDDLGVQRVVRFHVQVGGGEG